MTVAVTENIIAAYSISGAFEPSLPDAVLPYGSSLGKARWVAERMIAWLHWYRELRVNWERFAKMHGDFLQFGRRGHPMALSPTPMSLNTSGPVVQLCMLILVQNYF